VEAYCFDVLFVLSIGSFRNCGLWLRRLMERIECGPCVEVDRPFAGMYSFGCGIHPPNTADCARNVYLHRLAMARTIGVLSCDLCAEWMSSHAGFCASLQLYNVLTGSNLAGFIACVGGTGWCAALVPSIALHYPGMICTGA
jgi:hypothetical protein